MSASQQDLPIADPASVDHLGAIIIEAGISGMYQLYRLRELGVFVRGYEIGDGVRHLVLEPLSGRTLRFRELQLRVFFLGGTATGMGLE